jgi:hypothetical protein
VADKKFNIIFSGNLVEGSKPAEVLNKLCAVLRLEAAQTRDLFKAGAGAIIRQDLDDGAASALLDELRSAGAICTVQMVEPPPEEAAPQPRQVKKRSMDREYALPSGPVPGITLGGEPLVASYLPGKKSAVCFGATFCLWFLIMGINSNEFALHLISVALLAPYLVLLVECLVTQQVTLAADRVVKKRWFFGESSIPASKVLMTSDSAKICFYHGSKQNLRERITVRRSMVGQEMFDRLKIAAVSRFDILLKEEKLEGNVVASEGSGSSKERKISALLLQEYHKAVEDYRIAIYLFSIYAVVLIFITGLSDDFSGIAKSIPADGARFGAIMLTVAAYLLLARINPALMFSASSGARQQKSTWEEMLSSAKKSAFYSSLIIINVGTGGFCLFLLTGNLLDFYLFMTVACLFYTDFYPRLSYWERSCKAVEDVPQNAAAPLREPIPAPRRSLQISLVLLGTLAVSSYGDSRHYLYKNRKDCLDDWGGNAQDCSEPGQGSHYYRSGYWYGPGYGRGGGRATRSVGATMVSRGGFGSLGSFHASHGG